MLIDIAICLMFIVAWIIANIFLDVIRSILKRRNMNKMIDEAYLKISKLIVSAVADLKER